MIVVYKLRRSQIRSRKSGRRRTRRTLYEAVRTVLPDWWLVHPADADAVRRLAAEPSPRTVIWMDELQRYLDGPGGVPAAAVSALVAAGAAVVATIWPTEYRVRAADPSAGKSDQHSNDRELLRLAHVLTVPGDFTPAERHRAEALAADPLDNQALQGQQPGRFVDHARSDGRSLTFPRRTCHRLRRAGR
jgi:hypothetical protein